MAPILIVEDDRTTAGALQQGLQECGFDTLVAHDGETALHLAATVQPALVVLDLMLPGRDGLSVLRALHAGNHRAPVLILSARDEIENRVAGLNHGADDYMVKPFAFAELVARVNALLRRGSQEAGLRLTVSDLTLDVVEHSALRAGRNIDLTAREFDLLRYLMQHNGEAVSRAMLARDVWHVTSRATPLDNVIEVHITRLRRKVDDCARCKLLHTVRGVGYCLSDAEPPCPR
ncbi:MAG: response regulator transcription factor [Rhodocyclales bacterium]|nr:response regulator transcription factor [Rhodocyclales bacterium]